MKIYLLTYSIGGSFVNITAAGSKHYTYEDRLTFFYNDTSARGICDHWRSK